METTITGYVGFRVKTLCGIWACGFEFRIWGADFCCFRGEVVGFVSSPLSTGSLVRTYLESHKYSSIPTLPASSVTWVKVVRDAG